MLTSHDFRFEELGMEAKIENQTTGTIGYRDTIVVVTFNSQEDLHLFKIARPEVAAIDWVVLEVEKDA